MTNNIKPTIGAAMKVDHLPQYQAWLIEGQRDLELQDAISPQTLDSDWRPLARQIREYLDGYTGRLGLHGPFVDLSIAVRDPKIRAVVVERIQTALDFGAEVGATHMVLHSPFKYFGSAFLPHALSHGQADVIKLAQDTLAPVLQTAAQMDCTFVIETIFDLNPAPFLALVRSFESDHVKMSIDTGHTFITHQRGGPPPDQWVREGGILLEHLHVQDTDGQLDRHWLPGRGNINWYALFEALGDLEHHPRLILELKDYEAIGEGADWLSDQGYVK